jgi:hypothetical protein
VHEQREETRTVVVGANATALRTSSGAWEVLQFERADIIDDLTYDISGLLRGQLGTEHLIATLTPPGARVVLLSPALVKVGVGLDGIGLAYTWRIGPADRDIGHSDYRELTFSARGRGLVPFAPVHLRGRRDSNGLDVQWTRRTRIGGDGWDLVDVPLGEQSESYEIEFGDGVAVRRSMRSVAPSVTHSRAQMTSDFGTMPETVTVSVRQVSAVAGRGSAATLIL